MVICQTKALGFIVDLKHGILDFYMTEFLRVGGGDANKKCNF